MPVIDYALDDLWQPQDVRPGYSGASSPTNPGDSQAPYGNADVDFAPAFRRILADLTASVRPGAPLLPARVHCLGRVAYHFYSPLVINHPVQLLGCGVPHRSGNTRLLFHGIDGIHVRRWPAGDSTVTVGGLYIDGFALEYVGPNKSSEMHTGLICHRPVTAKNLLIRNFPGHGIRVEGNVHDLEALDRANASLTSLEDIDILYCGRSGLRIDGADANVCHVRRLSFAYNGEFGDDQDGFGVYDTSMLGCLYEALHARNNLRANYAIERPAKGVSPSRALLLGCYSEHSATRVDAARSPGPDILRGNCLALSTTGGGAGFEDRLGEGVVLTTAQNRLQVKDVLEVGGKSGASIVLGDATAPATPLAPRQVALFESRAYGQELDRYYITHDPNPSVRSWSFKLGSPGVSVGAFALTDRTHSRPGLPVAPRGLLIGTQPNVPLGQAGGPNGPRRLGSWDPRQENQLAAQFPNALPGDVVLNCLPNKGDYNFQGWVCAFVSTGTALTGPKYWCRFGEGAVGTPAIPAPLRG